jgi:dTDP-4-dehydrorhamnose reductase
MVAAVPRHAVLRVTNVFNLGDDVKNFLYRCVTTLRDGGTLELAADQLATPTYAPWLAVQTITLLERGALCAADSPRVLNVGCDELLSRVDFARRIAVALGADPALIVGRTTAELRQAAPRPLRGGLRNDLLKRLLGVQRIGFDEALADLLPRMRELYGAAAAS